MVPAAGLTAVSLACGLALAVFRAGAGCHEGIVGPFFLAFGRRDGRFPCGGVSGMLLGRLRRPGIPPRGLRLGFRFVRSPRLLLLELFASFKFRLWLL